MPITGNITSAARTSHVAPTPPQETTEASRPLPPPAKGDPGPARGAMQARGKGLSSRLHAQFHKLQNRMFGPRDAGLTQAHGQQAESLLDQLAPHHAPDAAGQHALRGEASRFLALLPAPVRELIDGHHDGKGPSVGGIEQKLHDLAALEKEHANAIASHADMDSPEAKHRASEIEKRIAELQDITTILQTIAELHNRANQIAVAAI